MNTFKLLAILAFLSTACSQNQENDKDNKKQQLVGAWSTADINNEVESATTFAIKELGTSSPLKDIISAKKQVVSGMNYEVVFKLQNNEIWSVKVYKDLSGNYTLLSKSLNK
ncbi:hypothetical protein EI427_12085 [Flammeovirga pectinis]|uniref:Cystatin domain-containing protein n=1 Tax=Flammeovirga pectinis TaxID=2494373 RepID=A0A3S9P428_9BACT|nr:cystatin domain-containing protein [Flammeovirga pectinis]AZQ62951.1 hypothetical protein EI427_12085 [Flammeovirga pectinis]